MLVSLSKLIVQQVGNGVDIRLRVGNLMTHQENPQAESDLRLQGPKVAIMQAGRNDLGPEKVEIEATFDIDEVTDIIGFSRLFVDARNDRLSES